jgi:hypothetical protein
MSVRVATTKKPNPLFLLNLKRTENFSSVSVRFVRRISKPLFLLQAMKKRQK